MADDQSVQGKCHCGGVHFRAQLADGLNTARRCTCSYCRMRGAVVVSAVLGGLTVEKGADLLTEYRFNTGAAKHYFCSVCGIYTHHQRRSNSNQFGVNVACLEGISPFDFAKVPVMDGVIHPSDSKSGGGLLGHLLFVPRDSDG